MLEEEDEDAGTTLELPFLETELGSQELDQALIIRQEEFVEVDRKDDLTEVELKDKKVPAKKCKDCHRDVTFLCFCMCSMFLHHCCQIIFQFDFWFNS